MEKSQLKLIEYARGLLDKDPDIVIFSQIDDETRLLITRSGDLGDDDYRVTLEMEKTDDDCEILSECLVSSPDELWVLLSTYEDYGGDLAALRKEDGGIDKGDIESNNNKESDNKNLSVFGFGGELIIGTLKDDEVEELIDLDEDDRDYDDKIERILGDITEKDNVFHFWGADSDEIVIRDSDGNNYDFKWIDINMEPTFDFEDSLDERFEGLAEDACETLDLKINSLKNKDWNSNFRSLRNLFREKPSSKKFIIASNLEKGYFGDIIFPADTPNENILLVSLTLEGMSITTGFLVGYLIYDNGTFIFNNINTDDTHTEEKQGFVGYLWDNNKSDTIWKGVLNQS